MDTIVSAGPPSEYFNNCPRCDKYRARIKELEELNDMHRRVNGELREAITECTNRTTKNDTEKK